MKRWGAQVGDPPDPLLLLDDELDCADELLDTAPPLAPEELELEAPPIPVALLETLEPFEEEEEAVEPPAPPTLAEDDTAVDEVALEAPPVPKENEGYPHAGITSATAMPAPPKNTRGHIALGSIHREGPRWDPLSDFDIAAVIAAHACAPSPGFARERQTTWGGPADTGAL